MKINIGTNYGNLQNVEVKKPGDQITMKDVLDAARAQLKRKRITVYGWARVGILFVALFLGGCMTNYRYMSKVQRKRVKKDLKHSYPDRLTRPHQFLLFKARQTK